ncbi:type I-E CRISPR-associated protein Cse1/CasA [Pseudogemmobacter faecipullorum]|uniref:Type I-E CRISPR-associated protein Cse1/CasA n=1 Tax=Pseudogemmobacter faecipullorum TaxID=2755041 RepID=A0ABS8CSN8_9RHOB|nr:type I-E CRISPR-associated protein Cse1/CasA [Pseudogemmobacter faecipullorum]MCB5412198.1 type I-E CRISPR-associated protein Cse1/CasA [Pseudogemmobacter faecipullorum]
MSLNLINDSWIPMRDRDGNLRLIAPWQMADSDLSWPAWPRPDLDIACIEFLTGLLRLADPPAHSDDWEDRQAPNPERLRIRLAAFAPAFELLGDGPRFMQELGGLTGDIRPAELLFLDSGGEGGAFTVHAGRYSDLSLPAAAMALYAMQTQAPSGGRGMLTSLRGGGGMSVLLDPGKGLWSLLWANVPDGRPGQISDLPWMRRTIPSDSGAVHVPPEPQPVEALFGMPRRYWLLAEGERVTGVIQRPSGTRYQGWQHPFAGHYLTKAGDEPLPVRPRPGHGGYRHWQGLALRDPEQLRLRPYNLAQWFDRARGEPADLILAGWAMSNAKAVDYLFSKVPLIDLDPQAEQLLIAMIEAANLFSQSLYGALTGAGIEGETRDLLRETLYVQTQSGFEQALSQLSAAPLAEEIRETLARSWLALLRKTAMALFEARVLPGLGDLPMDDQKKIADAHRNLGAAFAGYTPQGGKAFDALGLQRPVVKKKKEAA